MLLCIEFKKTFMKINKLIFIFVIITNSVLAQTISIAPFSGLNFSTYSYPKLDKDANSILTYPKNINVNPGMGFDIIYKNRNLRHVLSIASTPLGNSFKGKVLNRDIRLITATFKHAHYDRQANIGYQLFFEKIITKLESKHKVTLYYGLGASLSTNRSNEFYKVNNKPVDGGSSSSFDSIFFAFEYRKLRLNTGIFLMPEVGFTYYSKKQKPIVNLSLYSYIGLRPQMEYNLIIQYGKLNTSYFVEERLALRTRGGLFGFKLSFPFQVYTFKNKAVKNK